MAHQESCEGPASACSALQWLLEALWHWSGKGREHRNVAGPTVRERAFQQQLGSSPCPWSYRECSLEWPNKGSDCRKARPPLQRRVLRASLAKEVTTETVTVIASYRKVSWEPPSNRRGHRSHCCYKSNLMKRESLQPLSRTPFLAATQLQGRSHALDTHESLPHLRTPGLGTNCCIFIPAVKEMVNTES